MWWRLTTWKHLNLELKYSWCSRQVAICFIREEIGPFKELYRRLWSCRRADVVPHFGTVQGIWEMVVVCLWHAIVALAGNVLVRCVHEKAKDICAKLNNLCKGLLQTPADCDYVRLYGYQCSILRAVTGSSLEAIKCRVRTHKYLIHCIELFW